MCPPGYFPRFCCLPFALCALACLPDLAGFGVVASGGAALAPSAAGVAVGSAAADFAVPLPRPLPCFDGAAYAAADGAALADGPFGSLLMTRAWTCCGMSRLPRCP